MAARATRMNAHLMTPAVAKWLMTDKDTYSTLIFCQAHLLSSNATLIALAVQAVLTGPHREVVEVKVEGE